jgi:hypothetical protein
MHSDRRSMEAEQRAGFVKIFKSRGDRMRWRTSCTDAKGAEKWSLVARS